MKKNYSEMSNEELLKQSKLLIGVAIGLGVVAFLAIFIMSYIGFTKGFNKLSIPTLVPFFVLPITFLPMIISTNEINKELKKRNLK